MPPDQSVAHVSRRYRGEAGRRYQQVHDVPVRAHAWIAADRARKLGPFVDPNEVVLEYGVGPGWNLSAIVCKQRLGYDVADFLEGLLSAKGINFVADPRQVPHESVDTVICHHVLEHLPDPAAVLVEIGRLLRPRGKLIVVVPYERERRCRRFDPGEPNHHLFSWNVQTLGNLVTEMGFRVHLSSLGRYGYDRFLSVWAARLGIGAAGFRLIKKVVLAIMPLMEVRIVAFKMG
jgi:SAM-dependent methyltransferase